MSTKWRALVSHLENVILPFIKILKFSDRPSRSSRAQCASGSQQAVQDRRLRHVAVRGRRRARRAGRAAGAVDGARGSAVQRVQPSHRCVGLRDTAVGNCDAR